MKKKERVARLVSNEKEIKFLKERLTFLESQISRLDRLYQEEFNTQI